MALVKFGGGIIEMRGSIAGTVFSRNRGGNYARAKTTPVNPNTELQQTSRNALNALVARWRNILTEANRVSWNLYADSVTVLNRLGESTNITGFNHYIRSNHWLMTQALPIVDAAPTIFALGEADGIFAITISEATQLASVVFDPLLDWVNEDTGHFIVFAGTPKNPGVNFFDGPWRFGGSENGDSTTPPTSPFTFTWPYVVVETQKVWAYARILMEDGRISNPFRAQTDVAA